MLLGDADIEGAGWESLAEQVEPGAGRHGGSDGDDPVVLLRLADQAFGEDGGVARRIGGRLGLRAGDDVELVDAVILVGGGLGRGVALAPSASPQDQHRAAPLSRTFFSPARGAQIVPVDRADMEEAHFPEQRAAGDVAARVLHRPGDGAVGAAAERGGQFLPDVAQAEIGAAGSQPRQIALMAPVGGAIDMSLSLRMTMSARRVTGIVQRLKAMPAERRRRRSPR